MDGLSEADGDWLAEAEALGLCDADGLREALWLDDGLMDALGDCEADGDEVSS
jgi:hypothetical protein